MATDQRALKYTAQESRIILKYGLLYWLYYSETGTVKYLQVLLPDTSLTYSLKLTTGCKINTPGSPRLYSSAEKNNIIDPSLAARIARHINRCMKCMQTKRTDNRLLTPPMINTSKLAMRSEDARQMDIVKRVHSHCHSHG